MVMEVGIGSSMQLFVADFKMSSRIRSPVQTERAVDHQKRQRSVAHTVQVVTDTVSLVGEKVTKPIGQFGTGDV